MVCNDEVQQDIDTLMAVSTKRGLRKSEIREGHWKCLMDVVKSRLTGSSRASDISFPLVSMMNGIVSGKVYDWASLLATRMEEFMTLQHKTTALRHQTLFESYGQNDTP